MKISSVIRGFAVVAGCFALVLSLHAQGSAAVKKSAVVKAGKRRGAAGVVVANGGNVGVLTEAYRLMEHADRDYKGHRANAMRHVKEAGRLIGQRVGARGGGHEAQVSSDDQLRHAQSLLQQAAGSLSGAPREQINTALHELSVALAVR